MKTPKIVAFVLMVDKNLPDTEKCEVAFMKTNLLTMLGGLMRGVEYVNDKPTCRSTLVTMY